MKIHWVCKVFKEVPGIEWILNQILTKTKKEKEERNKEGKKETKKERKKEWPHQEGLCFKSK